MRIGARNRGSMEMMERVGQRHVNGTKMGGRYKPNNNAKGNTLMNRMKMMGNN